MGYIAYTIHLPNKTKYVREIEGITLEEVLTEYDINQDKVDVFVNDELVKNLDIPLQHGDVIMTKVHNYNSGVLVIGNNA